MTHPPRPRFAHQAGHYLSVIPLICARAIACPAPAALARHSIAVLSQRPTSVSFTAYLVKTGG